MKIYYITSNFFINQESKKELEKLGDVSYLFVKNISEVELAKKIYDAEIIIISPKAVENITKRFFELLDNLKYIILLSVGYDWIDIESAIKKNIIISNCRGGNSISVAEHTWGLILALSKKICNHHIDLYLSKKNKDDNYEGIEISGKVLGILGTGNIGNYVAKIAKSFNMKVLGYNRTIKKLNNFDIITNNLVYLLKKSDIISIHLPLTSETKNLINKNNLKFVKKGTIIVNTAREDIVNKKDILIEIEKGKIFGYGVDADRLEFNDPYFKFNNIIVNLHNAYNTKEAKIRTERIAIENLKSFLRGNYINVINI